MSDGDFPESALEFGIFDWIESAEAPAADIFEERLKLVEAADQSGAFYGWHIAEHQGTPLSLDISPAIVLASAIQRTERLRLGALTFCLPWYNPYRFYNEVCMLDQLSRGRLELGVGRGISPVESAYYGIKSIDESRERYRETLDIFMTACAGQVLDYAGKYHSYENLDLFNHPFQKPYPPLWFPSSNRDSIEFTASHGYNTVLNSTLAAETRDLLARYREVWLAHKGDANRHNAHVTAPKLGISRHVVVAESSAEANDLAGPAYAVWNSHISYLTRTRGARTPLSEAAARGQDRAIYLAGDPQSVVEQLAETIAEQGANYVMLVFQFGDLPQEHAMRSMALFAAEVAPAVKKALGSQEK